MSQRNVLEKKRGRPSAPGEPASSTMGQIFPGSPHDSASKRSSHWGKAGESLTQRFNRVTVSMVGFSPDNQHAAAHRSHRSSTRELEEMALVVPPWKSQSPEVKGSRKTSATAAKTCATSSPPGWILVSHQQSAPLATAPQHADTALIPR